MNLPNKLTLLRVLLIPIFLVVILGTFLDEQTSRYVATAIFIVASITDALDGYIARSQNLVTNFGKFMDPLADKLLVCAALIALIQTGDLQAWVVILIISREFIITGFRLIAVEKNVIIAAGFWGKLKTISQMVMIIFVILNFKGDIFNIINSILIWLSVTFTLVSAIEYIYKNINVLKDTNN